MPYGAVCLLRGMPYEGFDCTPEGLFGAAVAEGGILDLLKVFSWSVPDPLCQFCKFTTDKFHDDLRLLKLSETFTGVTWTSENIFPEAKFCQPPCR